MKKAEYQVLCEVNTTRKCFVATLKIVSYSSFLMSYRLISGAICSSLRCHTGGSDNGPAVVQRAPAKDSRMTGIKSWSRATTR
jgi:hypothetical protein